MKDEDKKFLMLERGRDFTLTALAQHLTALFGSKKSGSDVPFSAIDVQKYVSRGHLPLYLGGNSLTDLRCDRMGIKMVRIEDKIHESLVSKKDAKG